MSERKETSCLIIFGPRMLYRAPPMYDSGDWQSISGAMKMVLEHGLMIFRFKSDNMIVLSSKMTGNKV